MENGKGANQSLATPLAIIVAGFMIASAIYVSNTQSGFLSNKTSNNAVTDSDGILKAPAVVDDLPTQPNQEPSEDPNETGTFQVSIDDDPVLGDPNAPITLIEFSDFRCPFCARFSSDTLPEIKKTYIDTGKAKLVFRDLSIHPPQSDDAAMAAQCAGDQNKFWEYHDLLFQKLTAGDTFDASTLKGYASTLGLNQTTLDVCLDEGKYQDDLDSDYSAAQAATATGTPTLFIGKSDVSGTIEAVKVVGAQPFATFATEIDKLLP